MGDIEEIRTPAPPRPQYPGGTMPPRPPIQPQRGAVPPLRQTDSRGNLLMGQGPNPAGRLPVSGQPLTQQQLQQMQQQYQQNQSVRPAQINPSNQGPPRPYPWNRPQNPFPPRPQFGTRQPGAMGPPFRAPFQNQGPQSQMQQQQQPHIMQQQQHLSQQRPLLSANNIDDDDDVVMGQAVTPLKSLSLQNEQIESQLEETEPSFASLNPNLSAITGETDNMVDRSTSNKQNISGEHSRATRIHKGDNDSGVDESTQEKERNGPGSPAKTPSSAPGKGVSRPPSATPSNISSKSRSTSRNRLLLKTPEPEPIKKVPMNKVQVGHAPSPNLKAVRSKIGSLDNATYKPGGGNVKIESKKIEIKAAPRIEAKNDKYIPKGGEKKIVSTKLQWNAKSKIGSLENANHKPGGGDKKIETIKTEFKEKAKPKVGSKDNVKYVPGGGDIKKDNITKEIQTQKLEIKAQSKIGSLNNIKHKPGGGDKKIFDDKDYLKNVEHSVALSPPSQSPPPASMTTTTIAGADENLNQQS